MSGDLLRLMIYHCSGCLSDRNQLEPVGSDWKLVRLGSKWSNQNRPFQLESSRTNWANFLLFGWYCVPEFLIGFWSENMGHRQDLRLVPNTGWLWKLLTACFATSMVLVSSLVVWPWFLAVIFCRCCLLSLTALNRILWMRLFSARIYIRKTCFGKICKIYQNFLQFTKILHISILAQFTL